MYVKRLSIPFGDHVAVVIAFALIYRVLSHFALTQWTLMSGLRISALLLVPRKYWPALVLGEMLPVLEKTVAHANQFGTLWAVVASFPFVLMCMPILIAMARRMPMQDSNGNLRITTVLGITLVCSLATTIAVHVTSFFGYLTYPDPVDAWLEAIATYLPSILIGDYLGTLTIVPVAVVVYEYVRHRRRRTQWRPLMHDAFLLAVPYLAIFVAVARTDSPAASAFAELAIILPVISLTANHGRRGAAVGSMLSSIAMTSTFTAGLAPATLFAEGLLALVITVALISTRPSRPIRTFNAYPEIRGRIDRVSFFVERGLVRALAGIRQPSNSSVPGLRQAD